MPAKAPLLVQTIKDVTIANIETSRLLDGQQINQLGDELFRQVDELYHQKLIVDFSKVLFLSSSALGMLITLNKKAQAIKGQLVLCGLRKDLMKVFEITKLNKLFTFKPDEAEALAVFGVVTTA
jgi:anti-sigma B factor antagonist